MIGVIYKYTSPSGKIYIGQTCREKGRKKDFHSSAPYGGYRIDNARKKYGPKNFTYEVLFQVKGDRKEVSEKLNEMEQYYIQFYKSNQDEFGYNMNNGGAGNIAFLMNDKAREKISHNTKKWITIKGHPLKGKKHTKESIEKMRLNTTKKFGRDNPNYGWKPPKELLDRLAEMSRQRVGDKNPFYGKHISQANKDRMRSQYGKRVLQIDKHTGQIIAEYLSTYQAVESLGLKRRAATDVQKVCNKYINKNGARCLTAHGYKWAWANTINSQDSGKGSSTNESIG